MRPIKTYRAGLLALSLAFGGVFSSCTDDSPPKPYGVLPSADQMEWQKMEYYMFVHMGPNTFTDVEWGNGKEDPKVFNPTDLDCRQWAATAKAAGMKGIILTVKHHDGFCLWPSKYSTHTVRESPWKDGKGDVMKELSEACKEYDLKLGVYLSPWDQNHPAYGTPEYNQVFANTLTEVLSNYGPIFEQWFDGAEGESENSKKQKYDWGMFHDVVYKNQPNAIIFSDVGPGCRWMGNERGVAGETNWSRLNIEGFEPGGKLSPPTDTLNVGNIHGVAWVPAEVDVSIRPGWFFSPSTNDKVKTVDQLMDIYYTSVGRNANLLLNVPPDRRGRIHPNDSTRLMEFRKERESTFAADLSEGASIEASTTRANSSKYTAANLLDNNYDSYWTTDDDVLTASLEIDLGQAKSFNRLLLQEYIPLGQRIEKFDVEYLNGDKWEEVARATTIGYKRILRFPTVTTQKIRINIRSSLACPILNKVALFAAPEKLTSFVIKRSKKGLVSIACATPEPVIYYTADGSEPTTASKVYKDEFEMAQGGVVKAIAVIGKGKETSEVVSVTFDIAPTQWSIVSPDAMNISYTVDGNPETFAVVKDNQPLVIDLGAKLILKGFTYDPLKSETATNVYKYNLYGSLDGKTWVKVQSGAAFNNIKNNPIRQNVLFDKPIEAKFLKLESLQNTTASKDYTVADIGAITK